VWLHPLDGIGVNGVHALVVAPILVRVEMFRRGHTYDVLIARFAPGHRFESRARVAEMKQKVIPGPQVIRFAPWQIPVSALESPALLKRVQAIKQNDRTRHAVPDTATLTLPGME
jgi:hypothetical protein